ncbi:uncharacterized protein MELLADRAFT_85144 [Melampsora larici-populina 98AG31]|uniref:Uncharacterized protein n=1 Tax=Melampsora larici-populina (strain 98AG31 / pathotype 3-4-7) TaxID=747676 RepID=F4RHN5_MELLP|nr:uncharacterized protein MELLADRAFT_85144 [Melampsora larici-populina 98AG31]EGG07856.1 hypothetical protein MELLADRAFT_85144 [Melampsora larici-populina 98AG31]
MGDTPSTSNSKPTRRSLRKTITPIALVDSNQQNVGQAQVDKKTDKSKKRKKPSEVNLECTDGSGTGPKNDTLIKKADVSVGKLTSREQILDLLRRRINPKKPRLSSSDKKSRGKTTTKRNNKKSITDDPPCPEPFNHLKEFEINYSVFPDSQLVGMLQNIGLDTRGMNKEQLVNCCKVHQDLLELPEFYKSAPQSSPVEQLPAFLPGISASEPQSAPLGQLHDIETNAANSPVGLPSVSRTQPNPPIQQPNHQPSQAKSAKGKEKAVSYQDDTIFFEDDGIAFEASDYQNAFSHHDSTTEDAQASAAEGQNVPTGDTITITQLNSALTETNKRVQDLEDEVKTLSSVVQKLLGERATDPSDTTTCGGRIAARMRFHIETLVGQPSGEKILLKPASAEDKEAWMSQQAIDEFEFYVNMDLLPSITEGRDPAFPYVDGPGHANSSPQQLSVMWQMMKAVGVSSFRPDFSRSLSSKDNKWLWDLALKIFVKLVECGEYSGISLGDEGMALIKKSMKSNIQTLMKRFVFTREKWDNARKLKAANEVRRTSRLRHSLRERVVLQETTLWSLSRIIPHVCSDDETDDEGGSSTGPSQSNGNRPLRVRRLEWRSADLQLVCSRIDELKSHYDNCIPGTSPGQRGRRPRRRIRSEDGPMSRLEAPLGLPVDCYSADWLSSLSPLARCQLEIVESRGLHTALAALNNLF